jgi:hypothetical protein
MCYIRIFYDDDQQFIQDMSLCQRNVHFLIYLMLFSEVHGLHNISGKDMWL